MFSIAANGFLAFPKNRGGKPTNAITKDALPNRSGRISGCPDKAGLQYFNQSLRTRANLGRSLTFKTGFQTGLEIVNGEWTYLPGRAERTDVRGQCYRHAQY